MMNHMEKWKLTLAWGCLVIFFVFPIAMPTIQLMTGLKPNFASEFRYLGEFMRVVATIIISLADLNTIQIFRTKRRQTT
jgi:hypothetical protein